MKNNKDSSLWSHRHDFPMEETWNTSHIIAQFIAPRLRAFRDLDKHGYPEELGSELAWNKVLDKMIYAFELYGNSTPSSEQDWKDFHEGFDLFHKYYTYIWD